MNIREIYVKTASELTEISGDFAKKESEEIICFVCECLRSDIYLNQKTEISQNRILQIQEIVSRRKTGKPLAYCMNSKYFYDREFFVDTNVLIPRHDTEILVETVLKNEDCGKKFVLELGTGSGIISQILQSKRSDWRIISIDISFEAAKIAKKNCDEKIFIVNCDKFSAITEQNVFDIIVSNPPYIQSAEIENLDDSVKNYEPRIAIDGGKNGCYFYEYLARTAKKLLNEYGKIYCEIGFNQADIVPQIFLGHNFTQVETTKDFGGNPRVVCVRN
ncbi:MAG: peptide chain release factor N(5)-glutamine methyltransferase [Chitinispirillales bacterium]|jgi:release factor glutamine methyltransferase|nr:peptide chain release factor N(5)-glutamine methyltransferase [Chitinispirillales bacterium]